ncbi:Ammonium transporter [Acanthopleuribacter pedis]|uniref:Ammonium transporter n=2 Tax=Acanthopleuribacter pedis TaxID=442870 RepID=A0A8J7Q5H8_9BACT|nr:ammonium transporter [Acanthopleuribacter pedis]MBO1318249.1 ammonium transporter [Acanthopleuribacter pedis]
MTGSKKLLLSLLVLTAAPMCLAESATVSDEMFRINNTWMMVATFLVFIMHLGFAALEAGFTRAKNTVNILFKNVSILCIGILAYALVGFNLMYPGESFAGAFFGFAGFGINADSAALTSAYNEGYTYYTDFLFQAMFAATAATIISGAVAERIKLSSFMMFATLYVAITYPMVGMWKWGGGWLAEMGFHDFAGSTIVHGVGGWGALIAAWMLGPRIGRFHDDGHTDIHGHSLPLAFIGVFLLWLGWFGFNGGSVLSADPGGVSLVLVTTNLAAAAGVMGALIVSFTMSKTYNLGMVLNGSLAGLVAITAGADVISPAMSVIVGFIGGVLVVLGTTLLEKVRIDDPVGAVPVHLMCGIWGTLAVGIFGKADPAVLGYSLSFTSQLVGVAATGVFCLINAGLFLGLLKMTVGIRVSQEEETHGLDAAEHGIQAYSHHPFTTPN